MWIILALGSAVFAGLTAILAKRGIRDVDSNLATALRTVVVLLFSWLMVFIVGSQDAIASIPGRSLLFLVLSGLATGASWLCYFRALQLGDVNKVTPVDKSSIVLTILLSMILLGEGVSPLRGAGVVLIGAGTYLMIELRPGASGGTGDRRWLLYALGSAVFASLQSILGKVGIEGVDSTLGTALRTVVVLIMAWVIVLVTGKQRGIRAIDRRSWVYLALSGVATGASWLCYYAALKDGPASVVVPIDKLSILVTIAFSRFVLGERLSRRAAVGLALMTAGTLSMLF